MRRPAEGPGVAKNGLDALQPGGCEAHVLHGHLGRLIEEGRGDDLGFCADGLGSFGLHVLLVLFRRKAKLPGDPAELFPGLQAVVHKAEEAYAGHGVLVEELPRTIGLEFVNHILHCFLREAWGQVLHPLGGLGGQSGGWGLCASGQGRGGFRRLGLFVALVQGFA